MSEVVRDYGDFTERLKALIRPYMRMEALEEVAGYPLYRISMGEEGEKKKVLLSAGVHGDEPAGPEAVLVFLARDHAELLQHFRFCILPCVNPCGYVHNKRENGQGVDVNRALEGDEVAEARFIKGALEGRRFDFVADFHEDWEAKGFYMYEGRREGPLLGPEIVQGVEKVGPIDTENSEEDIPISKGVLGIDPEWGTQGMTSYVYTFHTDHVVTTETPSSWPLERRVKAQLTALDVMLKHYRER